MSKRGIDAENTDVKGQLEQRFVKEAQGTWLGTPAEKALSDKLTRLENGCLEAIATGKPSVWLLVHEKPSGEHVTMGDSHMSVTGDVVGWDQHSKRIIAAFNAVELLGYVQAHRLAQAVLARAELQ
jgi:hypothetical protein